MSLNDFRSVYMPYCLEKQADGKYVILNRASKPVGFYTREQIEYKDHPVCVRLKITSALAKKLSYEVSDNLDIIYLYDDGCVPTRSAANMNSYLKKLALLAKLEIIHVK